MKSLKDFQKYKSIIFDCDGVILQSNKMKTEAFKESLKGEKHYLLKKFIEYHIQNGGVSRYKKFEHYFSNIKKIKIYDEFMETALKNYSDLVMKNLITTQFVPGIIHLLKYLNNKKIECFVVSGGDQKQLEYVFEKRNIINKFKKILGSPKNKIENIEFLIKKNLITFPSIFFGDSLSDMQAANRFNMDFCFVKQFSEWKSGEKFTKKNFSYSIDNFESLEFNNEL